MNEGLNLVIFLALGLLVAAAGQLLLANLGVALGLTVLDWSPTDRDAVGSDTDSSSEPGIPFSILHLVGLGVALSGSLGLFMASLLTTELCQISEPRRGIVFGILLWSAYWVVLVWFSTTRLVGLGNAVLGTAIASSRQLLGAMGQLLSPRSSETSPDEQSLLHDLTAEVSQLVDLQRQLPDLLAHQREVLIAEIVEQADLSPDEAESMVAELGSHTSPAQFSPQESSPSSASRLLDQLDLPSWQQLARQLLNQVDFSNLDGETIWQHLQGLRGDQGEQAPPAFPATENVLRLDAQDYIRQAPSWSLQPEAIRQEFEERLYDPEADPEQIQEQLTHLTRADFVAWLQQRGDLTADQIETIADHLSRVQQSVMERVSEPFKLNGAVPAADIQAVAEKLLAYCRYTNLDALTPDHLTEKVETLRQNFHLPVDRPLSTYSGLDITPLTDVLARRQGMSEPQQQALTQALVTALADQPSAPSGGSAWLEQTRHRLESYFESVDWSAVSLEDIKPELMGQLQSLDLKGELDWQSLASHLQMPQAVKTDLVNWLQDVGQTLSRKPRRWAIRVGNSTQSLGQYLVRQITHYLKFQDKSAFRPEAIAKDLTQILKDAVAILPDPADWERLSDLTHLVDGDGLRATLQARQDMTMEQIQQVVGSFETAWQSVTHQVVSWTQTVWTATQAWFNSETDNLDTARQQLVKRIADARSSLKERAAQVKSDLQHRADRARQQVAIAAWWLFFSLLSSAGAAAVAGWLAVRY